ncbi:MAG: hypothetical protein ACHREM_00440 [Polyangiales bacterium]
MAALLFGGIGLLTGAFLPKPSESLRKVGEAFQWLGAIFYLTANKWTPIANEDDLPIFRAPKGSRLAKHADFYEIGEALREQFAIEGDVVFQVLGLTSTEELLAARDILRAATRYRATVEGAGDLLSSRFVTPQGTLISDVSTAHGDLIAAIAKYDEAVQRTREEPKADEPAADPATTPETPAPTGEEAK